MEVDSSFLDPIKEFHPILRVVEMTHEELAAMLPLRINLFSFVKHPYSESYGFPIDVPAVSGEELIRIHTMLIKRINMYGADTATIQTKRFAPNTSSLYNTLVALGFSPEKQEYCLRASDGGDPVVVYEDRLVPLPVVEQHINALAIYCNALHHDPKNGHSPLLTRLPDGYTINDSGYLIGRTTFLPKQKQPHIHGRWGFHDACDLLYTCIINFMRL